MALKRSMWPTINTQSERAAASASWRASSTGRTPRVGAADGVAALELVAAVLADIGEG